MELRQMRYFVRVVELGSMSRAAADLQLVQSALSQQISRLEGELSTRLLQRSSKGVMPTEAGLAFFREAQLSLRHADQASRAAQHSRLAGMVKIGMSPSTTAVLGLPFLLAMRERYPNVNVRLLESYFLGDMLNSRQLDLGVLFHPELGRNWKVLPLVDEKLFLVRTRAQAGRRPAARVRMAQLKGVPLVLPIGPKGLRIAVDAAFSRAGFEPLIALEVDSVSVLIDAISAGIGASMAQWSFIAHEHDAENRFHLAEIRDGGVRKAWLCSLSDSEMSPAALGARVVLAAVTRELVESGRWRGVVLANPSPS